MASMNPELASAIIASAKRLGVNPLDVGTAISYETGGKFDPNLWGGKDRNYLGYIQFGPEERAKYGVKEGQSPTEQMGAVENFLRDRGVKPGMGLKDIYSTINAGAPGLYNRSDAANGGMPGTVADKVDKQMGPHMENAATLLDMAPVGALAQDPTSPVDPTQTAAGAAAAPLSLAPDAVGALAPPTTAQTLAKLGATLNPAQAGQPAAPQGSQFLAPQQIQMPQINPQAQQIAALIAKQYGMGGA